MDDVVSVSFRPLGRNDFSLLRRWLDDPVVARWWAQATDADALEREYGPAVDGLDPGEVLVASLDGRQAGLVQRYRIDAFPEYVEELSHVVDLPAAALSIDYLIGEPTLRGRGLGAVLVDALVTDGWTAHPESGAVVVPVAAGNRASWRTLERAGFVRIARGELTPDNPIDPPDHVVYRRDRGRRRSADGVPSW